MQATLPSSAPPAAGARPLSIGVDATCWQNNRGYGRHTRALLRALLERDRRNRYTLFLDSADLLDTLPHSCAVELLRPATPASQAARANGRRSLGDMFQMGRALSRHGFDLLLFPSIYSFVPTVTRARRIVMIHDTIAETFPELTVPDRKARFFWNLKGALGRMQADSIVTVSDYSRRKILERFHIPPERVFVAGEAGDPVFRRIPGASLTPRLRKLGLSEAGRMVVYVGGFSPHKNLEALVGAFAARLAHPRFDDVRLVMVGEYRKEVFHSYHGAIAALVDRLGLASRTVFTGYLPDAELAVLLNLASVLVLPSLMEGFGLPAVEAAACGCPVIATTESPLPELLGSGGIFVPPRRPEIDEALERVLDSPALRGRMAIAGSAAAARLTWDAAARDLLAVIEKSATR